MSRRLPARNLKTFFRRSKGFVIHHSTGSHFVLKHLANAQLRVTVPYHNKDLKRVTLHSILKQTGLTAEEFLKWL